VVRRGSNQRAIRLTVAAVGITNDVLLALGVQETLRAAFGHLTVLSFGHPLAHRRVLRSFGDGFVTGSDQGGPSLAALFDGSTCQGTVIITHFGKACLLWTLIFLFGVHACMIER